MTDNTKKTEQVVTKKKDAGQLVAFYRMMRLIRTVESSLIKLFADGEIPGFEPRQNHHLQRRRFAVHHAVQAYGISL